MQQNSYSIRHLLGTVTTQWLEGDGGSHRRQLPAALWLSWQWQCNHRAAGS